VDVAHGAVTYETLAREYPTHKFADDALYFAADLRLASGEGDVALARLAEVADKYADSDFAADALFKSFWLRRQRGERAEAMALLDRIEKTYANAPESYEVERARYWRARMEEAAGEKVKAVRILTQLAVEHPATYYGWIARRRLATMDEKAALRVAGQLEFPPAGNPWPLFAGTLAKDPHFQAGVELLRLGFPEAVSSELLAADRTKQPAQAVRLIVQLLSLVGDQRAAHAVARTSLRGDLSGRITAENRAVWEIAYPLAFRDMVTRHCSSVGLDPDLLQALMREESALDPKALSWAGALGLTQLMPTTANAVAKRLKMGRIIPSRLLEPDLNIRLGSTYLGELVEQFEGTREYAVAGYNAGGGAVTKWRRERPTLELDEWVEEIPIAETRGYVKRVLRSYNTYQLLYPQPKPISQASLR
jgi:soluble lytic murein transglycosylase